MAPDLSVTIFHLLGRSTSGYLALFFGKNKMFPFQFPFLADTLEAKSRICLPSPKYWVFCCFESLSWVTGVEDSWLTSDLWHARHFRSIKNEERQVQIELTPVSHVLSL